MDDGEVTLIAQLAFIRSDLERFVFRVLASIDENVTAVTWPANEAELGHQLVVLGRALQQHAVSRTRSST
jgi:hypothetical protein